MSQNYLQDIATSINSITQSLDGTIAQIENLNRALEDNSKNLMESLTAVNENMRLIIEVIKKGRSNTKESLDEIKKHIDDEIQSLWNEKSLENIGKDQIEAVKKLKNINYAIGENLYMTQMLSIITSLRQILGQAKAIKLTKQTTAASAQK
ncbi:hypothetical protein NEF87_001842 [Candidatus Lokiarchaeum ossiferum]|uniref:Uncharacterized protein n=1 Tax=Candidatus Lokiarchaeum ossiferum TaxID=2951803 RepID=A0ABY6HPY2_9ARCH|nr:hypothetical protein NEF87_001842 [Candidatus Lokiarchaeum sp. B-35]